MQTKRGVTLIEILVVLAIIGITLGFALLAFGDFGASRRVVASAEQFLNQVKLLEQQAVLTSTTFGIQFDPAASPTSFRVLRFQPSSGWQRPSRALSRTYPFPAHTLIYFENTLLN